MAKLRTWEVHELINHGGVWRHGTVIASSFKRAVERSAERYGIPSGRLMLREVKP